VPGRVLGRAWGWEQRANRRIRAQQLRVEIADADGADDGTNRGLLHLSARSRSRHQSIKHRTQAAHPRGVRLPAEPQEVLCSEGDGDGLL